MENFIKAGAFDSLGGNRRQFMQVYESLIDDVVTENKKLDPDQMTIFDMMPVTNKKNMALKLPPLDEYPKDTILQMEKEVLGVYISGHPLDDVKDIWRKNVTNFTSDFVYLEELEGSTLEDKQQAKIGGIIASVNTRLTRKKEMMAIVNLEDLMGSVEVMIFPKTYEKIGKKLKNDTLVFMTGHVTTEDEADSKFIADNVILFDEIPKTLWIKFEDMTAYDELWGKVSDILKSHRGGDSVKIRIIKEDKFKSLPDGYRVLADEMLVAGINSVLGEGSAIIK